MILNSKLFNGALFNTVLLGYEDEDKRPIHVTFLDGGGSLARALRTPKFVRQQRQNEEALMMCGVM